MKQCKAVVVNDSFRDQYLISSFKKKKNYEMKLRYRNIHKLLA